MIVRALRLPHGRLALPKPSSLLAERRWSSTASLPERQPFEGQAAVDAVNESGQVTWNTGNRKIALDDPNHPVAQDYAFFLHQRRRTQHLGTTIDPHYKPHQLVTNPPWPKDITLELLMASQSHIGHATCLWNPANSQYIFGIHGDDDPIHIISLDVTATHLRRAAKIVSGVAERGGLVLFVGTRDGQARAIIRAAELAKGCHLFKKWIPGSISNGQLIVGRCDVKVVDEFDREVPGFESQLATQAALKPDLVVCLDPKENYILLHECGSHNIPTIGIIDTDANPTWVTYPIPGNDDSLRFTQLVAGVLGRAGQEGQERRLAQARKGVVTYTASHRLRAPTEAEKASSQAKKALRLAYEAQTRQKSSQDTVTSELDAPGDLVGVPVSQHQEDQALLQAADSSAITQGKESIDHSFQGGESPLEIAEEEANLLDVDRNAEDFIEPPHTNHRFDQSANASINKDQSPPQQSKREVPNPRIVEQPYGNTDAVTDTTPLQSRSLNLDSYNVAADAHKVGNNAEASQSAPTDTQQATPLQQETLNLDDYNVAADAHKNKSTPETSQSAPSNTQQPTPLQQETLNLDDYDVAADARDMAHSDDAAAPKPKSPRAQVAEVQQELDEVPRPATEPSSAQTHNRVKKPRN